MRTKTCPAILAFLLPFFLLSFQPHPSAQTLNLEHFKSKSPRNIGPAGMSGRVTCIDVVLSDPDVIYAGTASGGLWRSTGGGTRWKPIFDEAPVQSIGAVKVNQKNPDEIWVGTGEGNPRNSANSGTGIYKTIDGGKNWKRMGLENSRTIHRIILHRDDPNTVFVGVTGSAWGTNNERGVFKTTDGGKTWRKVLYIDEGTGCADLVADPSNPNKLIAAMWEYGRKPWTFNSGGPGSGLYISFDGGETWERRTDKDGLPKGDLGRIGLAIAPSMPNVVYALVEAKENALYKSTDGGFKWKKMASADKDDADVGNRPFYYHDIYVDPKNENRVYSIWSILSKSEDGGKTFGAWVEWKIHPDHHALWISPDDPSFIIEGNDGGMNISHDRGITWRFVENLPLAQFYHINYDMNVPYRVCGGMQDNGSWVGPSQVWKSGGIRNADWQEVNFGDGFDVMIRPDDPRYCYAMSQGGWVNYIDMETGRRQSIKPVHPDGTELRFNWNAAIAQNPFHGCGVYFGSQFLHKSMDCGQTWEIISPDLTTNDTSKQQQAKSGGLTIDDTEAENFTTIVSIAPSKVNEQVIWVGTDDGNVQVTQDGGATWRNVAANLPDVRPGSWITYIEAGKTAGEAFVVVNDYRRNDWKPYAFYTNNYGATFTRIVDEKKVDGHAFAIVQDPEVSDLLWLGTDHGLWFSFDFGREWQHWTEGFPAVSTTDLKIHPREQDLIIGTFGRAAWILDDIRPFREIARTKGKVLEKDFSVFDAPDAYLAQWASVDGTRFTGDAFYKGKNKSSQAIINCWVKPEKNKNSLPRNFGENKNEKSSPQITGENKNSDTKDNSDNKKDKNKKDEKAKIWVLNSAGDTIRTFTQKLDTGLVKINWNLRHDGVRYPSRRVVKKDADIPSGYVVLPGKYKLVIKYKDNIDSTNITVHADPRLDISLKQMKAKQVAYKDFYKTVNAANDGFKRLADIKKNIKLVDKALEFAPDSLKKEIAKLGKSLQDSIKNIEDEYMLPKGLKGIQRNPSLLSGQLWRTSGLIGASDGAPNQSARIMISKTKDMVGDILGKINGLVENDFMEYKKKVEAMDFSLFGEYEKIGLGDGN
ncbi:MAG TPA: hypothetical protein ENJ95_11010 [Bacteroidetes bacterium]|nr:hypothetical protein [Bacteroidota bacterium]